VFLLAWGEEVRRRGLNKKIINQLLNKLFDINSNIENTLRRGFRPCNPDFLFTLKQKVQDSSRFARKTGIREQ
jgi:hypothetical protein